MSTTITIRTDEALRQALEQRAREQGKSISTVVREILTRSLAEQLTSDRSRHLRGSLNLESNPTEPWRRKLADHNWRS
ncbi:MAG: FitA-like ribbon-helix-helix domain-containing protein [Wenzhouxiangellaceae bacterium]